MPDLSEWLRALFFQAPEEVNPEMPLMGQQDSLPGD
jgi:hypothetical protein